MWKKNTEKRPKIISPYGRNGHQDRSSNESKFHRINSDSSMSFLLQFFIRCLWFCCFLSRGSLTYVSRLNRSFRVSIIQSICVYTSVCRDIVKRSARNREWSTFEREHGLFASASTHREPPRVIPSRAFLHIPESSEESCQSTFVPPSSRDVERATRASFPPADLFLSLIFLYFFPTIFELRSRPPSSGESEIALIQFSPQWHLGSPEKEKRYCPEKARNEYETFTKLFKFFDRFTFWSKKNSPQSV